MLGSLLRGPARILILFILIAVFLAGGVWLGAAHGWPLAVALLLALAGWGAALVFRVQERARARTAQEEQVTLQSWRERLFVSERRLAEEERRLQALLRLNRSLAEAQDERSLMDTALSTVTGLVGALGCSFVPVDEWQQPLPAFTFGQLPEPVLTAWSAHLASNMLRERCGNCQVLESTPGACPLHPAQVGNALTVYCLPIHRPGKPLDKGEPEPGQTIGVLHLYLPAGRTLDNNMRLFLDGLLDEIALGYESVRLRTQEQVTLRQLQMLHATDGDFNASLVGLLDGLVQALEVDMALIRTLPRAGDRLAHLNIQRGCLNGLPEASFEKLAAQALNAAARGDSSASLPASLPVWLALPLTLPEGPLVGAASQDLQPYGAALGVLIVLVNHPHEFHPRQQAILQTVAAQAALLVENERMTRSLEYKVVIQERARLAREIHDGLAQTLAFLKLQAAQMQTYLAQGDTARLSQVLKDNYQVLAEAYLDTRQAIDNLRLTPQQGLESWLDRILNEFETTTGLRVERSIQTIEPPVAPEIQAQLIRIVQEALSNVRKHARARTVQISLREWQGERILEVSDDGLGFAAEDVPDVSRHGLRGMRERAELIGADFQIISQARQGTIVRLVLPASLEEEPLK